jgi:hypothetical protein
VSATRTGLPLDRASLFMLLRVGLPLSLELLALDAELERISYEAEVCISELDDEPTIRVRELAR